MKLVCPQCRTAYDVAANALGMDGRQVRCIRCKSTWFAEPPKLAANVIPLPPQVPRAAPLGVVGTEWEEPSPADGAVEPAAAATPATPGPERPAPPPDAPAAAAPAAEMPAAGPTPAVAASAAPQETAAPAAAAAPSAPATETDAPALAAGQPEADPAAAAPQASAEDIPPHEDIETVAARRLAARGRTPKRPQRTRRRLPALAAAAVTLAIVNAALIYKRADIVRALPQTASLFATIGLPVNLRQLKFSNIKTSQELHDGVTILVIEGDIVATGHEVTEIPRLRFAIGAANGHEIYAWTALPSRTRLAPGETLPFRTRLASPPEQGRSVKVRFFTRLDLTAGLR